MDLAFTCAKCRLLDLGKGDRLMDIKLLWFGPVGWDFLWVAVFKIMMCYHVEKISASLRVPVWCMFWLFLIPREIIHDLVN